MIGKRRALSVLLAIASMAVFSVVGCKSAKKADDSSSEVSAAIGDANTLGDSDSGKAMGLQTVYFPYDSFSLTGDAKSALKANLGILKSNSSVAIQVEGHCDQRGGIQYNIALGEKRANAVKKYLQSQGIPEKRISTISYGKERPIDSAETESAYAKNRRANFVITSR